MKARLGIVFGTVAAAICTSAAGEESSGNISKWNAAPVFKGDGWEFKIGGRVMLDYAFVDADVSGAGLECWRAAPIET